MTFEEFYQNVMDSNAVLFYAVAVRDFLDVANASKSDPRSLDERLKNPGSDINEKARQYANSAQTPMVVSKSLKRNYSISQHVLVEPELSIPALTEIYNGYRELDIPLEDVLG